MTSGKAWRVLVAEDDRKTADLVALYLRHAGHSVRVEHDGTLAQRRARAEPFDLAVLDVMLPGVDGLALCREFAQAGHTAVILLTARTQEHQRIEGLQLGADDYISKPFSPRELVARVDAVMRRRSARPLTPDTWSSAAIHVGGLVLEPERRRVLLHDREIHLTPSEFAILHALALRPERVLSRAQLLDTLPGESQTPTERTVDVHIRNLRRKLERVPSNPAWIRTVTGSGYALFRAG